MRLNGVDYRTSSLQFQFTHPGRGATACRSTLPYDQDVSIHAPREGCDHKLGANSLYFSSFNSRTPGGVRRHFWIFVSSLGMFQFTHPGRGATGLHIDKTKRPSRFNSRTPGGVRHPSVVSFVSLRRFNSRTPGGVRPDTEPRTSTLGKFQFTHPGRGATVTANTSLTKLQEFQFTHPGRGATTAHSP